LRDAIAYWNYELTPKRRLSAVATAGPRRGALIRVEDGFADVHPWPELGDAPLDVQLALLARGELTPLTRASLRFAALDAAARVNGRSLFEGLTIPRSHWPGVDHPPDFDVVKLKSAETIPSGVRLRIDFNGTLSPEQFLHIASSLPHERIDFIEDPCPYDAAVWRRLRVQSGLRLARDRCALSDRSMAPGEESGFDVAIVKPAVDSLTTEISGVVVTSYMDHPIGQLCAAYTAAAAAITTTCGLVTHVLFENDPFIERMQIQETRLVPPAGTGWGFDDLLQSLPWRTLA